MDKYAYQCSDRPPAAPGPEYPKEAGFVGSLNAATRQPQLLSAIGTLNRNLGELGAVVGALEDRLHPLLRDSAPQKMDGVPEEQFVPAAAEIRSASRTAATLAARMQSVLDRLEV